MAAVSPRAARADAWTQEAGHGQIIVNATFSDIAHQFDSQRRITLFGDGGSFRKLEINPYFEFGLTRGTTLLVNAFVPSERYSNVYGAERSFGLGDVETGLRQRLNKADSATAISTQVTVQFPTYPVTRNPAPGNHQKDVESRFMVGRGISLGHHHAFVSTGVAYRYRDGPPADQFRSDATWGFDASHRFTFLVQYYGITGLRNGQPVDAGNNPNLQSDFDLYKAQASLVTRLSRTTRIQLGWIDAFAGRNTGHGQTLLVALWQDF